MRRQPRPEPERPYLVAADALVAEAQLDDLREERRNHSLFDEIDLPRDERRQRIAVDRINSDETPKPALVAASSTTPVALCLGVLPVLAHDGGLTVSGAAQRDVSVRGPTGCVTRYARAWSSPSNDAA